MMSEDPPLDELHDAARRLRATTLHELFAREPERATALTFAWNDWRADIAKERIDGEALDALLRAAERGNLPHWIAALFAGEKINLSERRPVLHPLLRTSPESPVVVDGINIVEEMRATRERMSTLTSAIRE